MNPRNIPRRIFLVKLFGVSIIIFQSYQNHLFQHHIQDTTNLQEHHPMQFLAQYHLLASQEPRHKLALTAGGAHMKLAVAIGFHVIEEAVDNTA
jgi:hypothetical protein